MQPSSCYIVMLFLDNLNSTLIVIPWWLVWIEKLIFCPSLPKDHDCEGITENFGDMYLGKKTIATDVFFILENIKIYCHMHAGEFGGLL